MRSTITCRRVPIPDLVRELFPTLMAIIHAHADGTRYGIRVDPADGLLHAGEPGHAADLDGRQARRSRVHAADRQAGGNQCAVAERA